MLTSEFYRKESDAQPTECGNSRQTVKAVVFRLSAVANLANKYTVYAHCAALEVRPLKRGREEGRKVLKQGIRVSVA
jgi:hypothetical protein